MLNGPCLRRSTFCDYVDGLGVHLQQDDCMLIRPDWIGIQELPLLAPKGQYRAGHLYCEQHYTAGREASGRANGEVCVTTISGVLERRAPL